MKMFRNLFPAAAFIMTAVLLIATGCKKEKQTAPSLPPQSSFVMDYSAYSNPSDTIPPREVTTYHNWSYAFTVVFTWNSILDVALAVPVATFLEAFNHEAIYHPDQNNWTWSYNVTVNQAVYEAVLTGYIVADSAVWEMRVTKGNEYSDFLWYHGKSSLDQNAPGGYWILREDPANPDEWLRIDWHKYSDGTADLQYKNIKSGAPEEGAYIFYGTTLNYFDRFYHIFSASLNNLTEIEWSSANKDGHVKDPHHFADEQWHCWDTSLKDMECQ